MYLKLGDLGLARAADRLVHARTQARGLGLNALQRLLRGRQVVAGQLARGNPLLQRGNARVDDGQRLLLLGGALGGGARGHRLAQMGETRVGGELHGGALERGGVGDGVALAVLDLEAVAAHGGGEALVGGGHQLELGLGLDGRADLDGRGQSEDGCVEEEER